MQLCSLKPLILRDFCRSGYPDAARARRRGDRTCFAAPHEPANEARSGHQAKSHAAIFRIATRVPHHRDGPGTLTNGRPRLVNLGLEIINETRPPHSCAISTHAMCFGSSVKYRARWMYFISSRSSYPSPNVYRLRKSLPSVNLSRSVSMIFLKTNFGDSMSPSFNRSSCKS
jgi:hypothetical protein